MVHRGHLGPTDVPNLVLLCCHHHWSVHEGDWTLVHTDDDGILAISPVIGVMTPLRDPGPILPGTPPVLAPPHQPHRAREPALPSG